MFKVYLASFTCTNGFQSFLTQQTLLKGAKLDSQNGPRSLSIKVLSFSLEILLQLIDLQLGFSIATFNHTHMLATTQVDVILTVHVKESAFITARIRT